MGDVFATLSLEGFVVVINLYVSAKTRWISSHNNTNNKHKNLYS